MCRLASLVGAMVAAALSGCSGSSPARLSAADSSAIRATQAAYVAAWLRDDTSAVLATLDTAAVLLPPQRLPVAGHATIRGFWWPQDGSRTRITSFVQTIDEVGGTRDVAYTRGISALSWTYDKDTLHQVAKSRNTNLTVLRRGDDGRWLITHQMWSPSLPQ